MTKVRLTGTQQQQFQIGNSFFPGATVVDLTKDEIKKHKDIIIEVLEDKPEIKEIVKENLDLNNDGKIDDKDATLAGKVLQARKPRKRKVKK